MRNSCRWGLASVAVGVALVATACGAGPEPTTASDAPRTGGDATIVLGVDAARGLDPAALFNLTPSGDANRMSAIFDVLFAADAATGEVTPGIGESLTSDADGRVWTLTLRAGVRFSDGTPFDAEAVKFNYERIADPATKSPLAGLVAGVTFAVADERTLTITLPAPNSQFDRTLALNLTYIGSPTALRADPAAFAEKPVGAGPFVLEEWVRDDHMTLVRNPAYYQEGRPYLDSVTFRVIADPVQRINAVTTGQAHAAVPGSELSFAQRAEGAGLAVTRAAAGGGPTLMFNTARAPFDDVRARRAVALAIDGKDLAAVVDPGSSQPESLYGPDSPFHPDERVLPGQDKDEAQQLFTELAADGKPVRFTVSMPGSGFFRRTAEYLQSRLSQFRDVEVAIEVLDNASLDRKVFQARDFDLSAQIVPVPDPEPNLYKLLHSGGQTNYMSYSSPEVDAALDEGRQSTDEATRAEAYATVERLVARDVPILPFRNQATYTVHSSDLVGLSLHGDGCLRYDRLGLAG
ncbi:ABC transporter substrate-binding protein [Actinophytocola glycyrrhizae]|uniref:ABC transporter substrate-binding protein n=1 Tax=Actinophytocola glycyrrhizae TaxID=2044873 RepID=A0ABV9S501_9PSEU